MPREQTELRVLLATLRQRLFGDEQARQHARFALLDRARRWLMPEYRLTDFAKAWWSDDEFLALCRRLDGSDLPTAERKYFLRELLKLVAHLDGDTAEAGVYRGATSWLICNARSGRESTHWAFDSFEGLSAPRPVDGSFWRAGDLTTAAGEARGLLAGCDAHVLQGWIPDVFAGAEMRPLVFAHIDVDLHDPTLASLEFFYPRTLPGGVIICDDYGLTTCPGATRAFDEYMAKRPEPIISSPTGQGFVVKQSHGDPGRS